MWQDPRFSTAAAVRWAELRAGPWSDAAVGKKIAGVSAQASRESSSRHRGGPVVEKDAAACICPFGSTSCLPSLASSNASPLPGHRGCCPGLPGDPQIKPAVLRNFDRYEAVLLKPWYSNSEQEWTSGEGDAAAVAACCCQCHPPRSVPPPLQTRQLLVLPACRIAADMKHICLPLQRWPSWGTG